MTSRYGTSLGPNLTIFKLIFLFSMTGYGIVSTVTMVCNEFYKIFSSPQVNTMIFDASISAILLWVGLILGVVISVGVNYFVTYEDCKKQKLKKGEEVPSKFDIRYIIAGLCSIILAVFITYLVVFFGLDYFYSGAPITQGALAFFIAFWIGVIVAFAVDAVIFHGIANGTLDAKYIALAEKTREVVKDKTFRENVAEIAKNKGIVDNKVVEGIVENLKKLGIEDASDGLVITLIDRELEKAPVVEEKVVG